MVDGWPPQGLAEGAQERLARGVPRVDRVEVDEPQDQGPLDGAFERTRPDAAVQAMKPALPHAMGDSAMTASERQQLREAVLTGGELGDPPVNGHCVAMLLHANDKATRHADSPSSAPRLTRAPI